MPRIAGVNIPDDKRIEIALTYIYGIGRSSSKQILAQSKFNPDIRAGKLNAQELNTLRTLIEETHKVEGV